MKGRSLQLSSCLSRPVTPFRASTTRYICLQCRHRVARQYLAPRANPTSTPSLHRTYATEPGLPDRIQNYFAERIAPKMFKGGEIPKAEGDTADIPTNNEEVTEADDIDYKPATSGEELEAIGGPSGWWEKAWDEEHQFQGFMRPTPMQDPQEIRQAIERALVEYYTAQKGGRAFQQAIGVAYSLWANGRSWELLPVGNFALWRNKMGIVALKWERSEDMMEMQRWLLQPFREADRARGNEKGTRSESEWEELAAITGTSRWDIDSLAVPYGDATQATAADSEDSTIPRLDEDGAEPAEADSEDSTIPRLDEDGADPAEPALIRYVPTVITYVEQRPHYTGVQGDIRLNRYHIKFTVIKRVMQLTGIRIPDTAIQSIDSSSSLFNHLIQKPKPKKVAQLLLETHVASGRAKGDKVIPQLGNLPNVKIHPTKYLPSMAETALGRQKVIDQELDRHGIPVPFRDESEQITAYEEQRLRQQIDAMSEDDAADLQDVWGSEALEDDGREEDREEDREVYR
ncbi:MAG: hypothetical protein Q9182_004113 [Xanthomendoza sp. 2 TL-2023]